MPDPCLRIESTNRVLGNTKVEFEIIDKALNTILQSKLDPVTADKVTDLRNIFQDAYTGWLEIYEEAA
jgi:hypothetical protein